MIDTCQAMQWKQIETAKFLRIDHKNLREAGVTSLRVWRTIILVARSSLSRKLLADFQEKLDNFQDTSFS